MNEGRMQKAAKTRKFQRGLFLIRVIEIRVTGTPGGTPIRRGQKIEIKVPGTHVFTRKTRTSNKTHYEWVNRQA